MHTCVSEKLRKEKRSSMRAYYSGTFISSILLFILRGEKVDLPNVLELAWSSEMSSAQSFLISKVRCEEELPSVYTY